MRACLLRQLGSGGMGALQPGWGDSTFGEGWMVLVTRKRRKQALLEDPTVRVRQEGKRTQATGLTHDRTLEPRSVWHAT